MNEGDAQKGISDMTNTACAGIVTVLEFLTSMNISIFDAMFDTQGENVAQQ